MGTECPGLPVNSSPGMIPTATCLLLSWEFFVTCLLASVTLCQVWSWPGPLCTQGRLPQWTAGPTKASGPLEPWCSSSPLRTEQSPSGESCLSNIFFSFVLVPWAECILLPLENLGAVSFVPFFYLFSKFQIISSSKRESTKRNIKFSLLAGERTCLRTCLHSI